MNKIEILKAEKKGITFGKSVFDAIKENKEFGELFSLDLAGDYVRAMVNEVVKDKIVIAFDKASGKFQDILISDRWSDANQIFKVNEVVDFCVYGSHLDSSWNTFSINLKNLYIVTDVNAYSEYLLASDEEFKNEQIKRLEAQIAETKANHADMIRLGLKLYEVRQLRTIRKIEKQRGSQVKKEEVSELLSL